jgi:RNA polymerase sigma-70 factor (ECF subfamily)
MSDEAIPSSEHPELAETARRSWLELRRALSSLRPELYRFCRSLTPSPWDAEDLVQETLMRAFVTLGSQYGQEIEKPRAWLFRVATNAWIDRKRQNREVLVEAPDDSASGHEGASDRQHARELAGTVLGRLSPHERVALVLKDGFDFPLDDVAAALGTTTGAVKAALHRGRGKLTSAEPPPTTATPSVVSAFCAAFNAGDLERLTALLLDSASIELPGVAVDVGVAASKKAESGILYHSLLTPLSTGVPAQYLTDYLPTPPRAELRAYRGEHLLLLWYRHQSGEAVRSFIRVDIDPESGLIARVREYYYSPEALSEVAAELSLPHRSNGYGF